MQVRRLLRARRKRPGDRGAAEQRRRETGEHETAALRKSARNFNPMMATAGKITVAEVEELVEPGELEPDQIHTPSIYVQRIFQGSHYQKPIEQRTVRPRA